MPADFIMKLMRSTGLSVIVLSSAPCRTASLISASGVARSPNLFIKRLQICDLRIIGCKHHIARLQASRLGRTIFIHAHDLHTTIPPCSVDVSPTHGRFESALLPVFAASRSSWV
jgi:hypothetical protein